MKRNWKEDIHDRLGNFETDAPDGLWEAIHQRMAQTERAQAEKRQTPFVLQPALRRTACAAAACLALVVGYQYFADGGKETANGVKQAGGDGMIAVGGTVASDNSRYVASKPATASIVATNLAGVRVAKNGVTSAAVYAQTQNDESAQISTPQHLNPSTSQPHNPSTPQPLPSIHRGEKRRVPPALQLRQSCRANAYVGAHTRSLGHGQGVCCASHTRAEPACRQTFRGSRLRCHTP